MRSPKNQYSSAVLSLSNNRTLVGRALDSDLRVANQEVSRHHVVISRENGTTTITDLGAANGTFVNDERLTDSSRTINAGDRVVLGNLSFTYRPLF